MYTTPCRGMILCCRSTALMGSGAERFAEMAAFASIAFPGHAGGKSIEAVYWIGKDRLAVAFLSLAGHLVAADGFCKRNGSKINKHSIVIQRVLLFLWA